jgi:predicted phosphodiesterase
LLVLSDLHLGDPRAPSTALSRIHTVLAHEKPDILVLDGDVLEENLATDEQFTQLKVICQDDAGKIVVLNGNHDCKLTKKLADELHCPFDTQAIGFSSFHSFAVEHGNRFDSWWKKVPGLGWLSIWLNHLVYRVTGLDIQKWLRTFKCVQKKLRAQHKAAVAAWEGKSIVVTGHTHLPTNDQSGIGYFNPGDWLIHFSYVVLQNGKVVQK